VAISIGVGKSIPFSSFKRHLDELPRNKLIVNNCGTGVQTGKARNILEAAGLKAVNDGGYATILRIVGNCQSPRLCH
jgi:rhodanese-related sulfurtransferase